MMHPLYIYLNSALASAASLSRNASISPSRGEKAPTSAAAFRADSMSILLMLFLHTCCGKMSIPTKVSRAHLQNCRGGNLTRNFWHGTGKQSSRNDSSFEKIKKIGNESFFRPVFLVLLHLPNFSFFREKIPGMFSAKTRLFFFNLKQESRRHLKKTRRFFPRNFFSALNEI